MKLSKTLGYWALTGLLSLAMAGSAFAYLSGAMNEAAAALGYPTSFVSLMGVLKGLGAIGLIVPALPRVKEWVYAGFFFTFVGAAWSHYAIGDGVAEVVSPLVMLGMLIGSYVLRPERLWLAGSPFAGGQAKTASHRPPVSAR